MTARARCGPTARPASWRNGLDAQQTELRERLQNQESSDPAVHPGTLQTSWSTARRRGDDERFHGHGKKRCDAHGPAPLAPAERAEALQKAAALRKERGKLMAALKAGTLPLATLPAREDAVVGKVRVRRVLESLLSRGG